MTAATSLILIAVGAILAFAVSTQVAGINIQTVGIILVIVGGIGLAIVLMTLAGYAPWGARTAPGVAPATAVPPGNVPPPPAV